MYLADTNVLSSSAPNAVPSDVMAWMEAHSSMIFLSVNTIIEIGDGIAKAKRLGMVRLSGALDAWLDTVLHIYGNRVLDLDLGTARQTGRLLDHARATGHAPDLADVAIAATALHRGYTVLTRNLRHFRPLGVAALDPFVALPPG